MAKIVWEKSTTTAITVFLAELMPEYGANGNITVGNRQATWYLDGVMKGVTEIPHEVESSDLFVFEDLHPNTSYQISCRIWNIQQAGGGTYGVTVYMDGLVSTLDPESLKPNNLICVQRFQPLYDSRIFLKFYATVPSSAYSLRWQIATDTNFNNIKNNDISDVYWSLEDYEHISDNTYCFYFYDALPSTTYYVRAEVQNRGLGYGGWCNYVQITTPPSRKIFDDSDNVKFVASTASYGGLTNHLRLYIRKPIFDYEFDSVEFEIYKDGILQNLSYIDKGSSSLTACDSVFSVYLKRSELTGVNVNGVLIANPLEGTYKGVVRFYKEVEFNEVVIKLQPVDDYGNNVCAELYCTIESTILRPDPFDWDATKTSGGEYNLTANEWNRLTGNINDVLEYKDKSTQTFTTAIKNETEVTADIFKEAISAINNLHGYSRISEVSPGQVIYATIFDEIKNGINNIE